MTTIAPPCTAADFLGMTLSDIAGWHLVAKCGRCRDQGRMVPIARLIAAYGPQRRVADVVARLRCSSRTCGERPARVRALSREDVLAPDCIELVLVGAK